MSDPAVRSAICAVVKPALRAVAGMSSLPIQDDPNMPFDRPAGPWARISFADGAPAIAMPGSAGNALERHPFIVYVDLFDALGAGDGLVGELAKAGRDSLRRLAVTGARWWRSDSPAPEGIVDGYYRRQIAELFRAANRV